MTIDHARAADPELPRGMNVDGATLVSLSLFEAIVPDHPVRLTVSTDRPGDAETGEWLDSMSFRSEQHVVQVAVRDAGWLAATDIRSEWVTYEPQGFTQTILEAPAGTILYVSLVWCTTEPTLVADDVSTWFAADLVLPDGRHVGAVTLAPNSRS